jgi:hypothetical protein
MNLKLNNRDVYIMNTEYGTENKCALRIQWCFNYVRQKPIKLKQVGIIWIVFTIYSEMSTFSGTKILQTHFSRVDSYYYNNFYKAKVECCACEMPSLRFYRNQ